ncbi:hypothetical protein ACFWCB_11315 [Streptomyces sp. NPDC060048]|uniref:hypothetical protein n=1 Tax=unclassified Streptomyces TaxID=2593676 RepID=UPI0036BB07AB
MAAPRCHGATRRDAGDLRRQNPGQLPGDPRNRAPRPRHDPRITEIAHLARRSHVTTTEIAHRYEVSDRTAQRPLAAARQHASTQQGELAVVEHRPLGVPPLRCAATDPKSARARHHHDAPQSCVIAGLVTL